MLPPIPKIPARIFKYTTAESAKKILLNCSLKWSSPLHFNKNNDKFDVARSLFQGVSAYDLCGAINFRLHDIIIAKKPAPHNPAQWVRDFLNAPADQGLKALALSRNPGAPMLSNVNKLILELEGMWVKNRPELRVQCLTESHTNSTMWTWYADKNTGTVLEFNT